MFHSKQDVDRHVDNIFKNVKNESERNLKCFKIAKLYYAVNDYKSAIKFVNRYLSTNSSSAPALKLLGESYIQINMKTKALDALKSSLEIDGSQKDLVFKVCELLADPEMPVEVARATYWLERAESLDAKNSVVFKLKEHLLKKGSSGKENYAELEKLILAEVSAHPTDVKVRIRLLNFFIEFSRYQLAYEHALELEERLLFYNELKWYDCLCNLLELYEKSNANARLNEDFEFFVRKIAFLERRADLSMNEFRTECKSVVDCSSAVFAFDQALQTASRVKVPDAEVSFFQDLMRHMGAQLTFQLATLSFKKAKKECGMWPKAVNSAAPLLFLACESTTFSEDDKYNSWIMRNNGLVKTWNKAAALRLFQAGHILLALAKGKSNQFLQKVSQYCAGTWRNRVYMEIFSSRIHHQGLDTSFFISNPNYKEIPLQLIPEDELIIFNEISQSANPESLHHLVWLGLVSLKSDGQLNHDFRCTVLPDLQFTVENLLNTGPETLNQLDVDAFLYASVLCAKASMSNYINTNKPTLLPISISEELCTPAQADWWSAVYDTYRNRYSENVSEVRLKLRKGIETVRVSGQHGLHVKLIVLLAKIFVERASKTRNSAELAGLEDRGYHYWLSAVLLLEKVEKNLQLRTTPNCFFDYRGNGLTSNEAKTYYEEGKLFLACRLMKLEQNEGAIEAFESLKSPQASFYQGMIYRKMASEVLNMKPESITSENRAQHIILLTRSRDAFLQTTERLKSPSVDSGHPLHSQVQRELDEVESQLAIFNSDDNLLRNGDINTGGSEGGVHSLFYKGDDYFDSSQNFLNTSGYPTLSSHNFQTKRHHSRDEEKSSIDRLEDELYSIVKSLRDIKINQNKLKEEVNDVKRILKVKNNPVHKTKTNEFADFRGGANYPSFSNYSHPGLPQGAPGAFVPPTMQNPFPPSGAAILPNPLYSGSNPLAATDLSLLYQNLGCYSQGAVPFSGDQSLSEFRNTAALIQALRANAISGEAWTNMNASASVNALQSPNFMGADASSAFTFPGRTNKLPLNGLQIQPQLMSMNNANADYSRNAVPTDSSTSGRSGFSANASVTGMSGTPSTMLQINFGTTPSSSNLGLSSSIKDSGPKIPSGVLTNNQSSLGGESGSINFGSVSQNVSKLAASVDSQKSGSSKFELGQDRTSAFSFSDFKIENDRSQKAESTADEEISIIYEAKASPEDRKAAVDLHLPPNFYLYLKAPNCPGCIGCEKDDPEPRTHTKSDSLPSKSLFGGSSTTQAVHLLGGSARAFNRGNLTFNFSNFSTLSSKQNG